MNNNSTDVLNYFDLCHFVVFSLDNIFVTYFFVVIASLSMFISEVFTSSAFTSSVFAYPSIPKLFNFHL